MKKIVSFAVMLVMAALMLAVSASAKTVGYLYGDALVIGNPASPVYSVSTAGVVTTTGAQTITGAQAITGNQTVTGNQSVSGSKSEVPSTTYSSTVLYTTNTISASGASFIVINGSGAIVMGSTPTIATTTAVSGQSITLFGGTNAVTFTDEGSLTGSLLELGSTTRALGAGDMLKLRYYGGKWYEEGFVNN